MKVLIVEPGKYPREADIEHTLEAEQAVVGGTIEAVYPWRDSACLVCNDNGIAENLPLNRMLGDYDIIHGTFFVCGLTSNDFTDLSWVWFAKCSYHIGKVPHALRHGL